MQPAKKPIPLAPAPARFGAIRPRLMEAELDASSSSSSDEEPLVARSRGMYAELEGFEADEVEEELPVVDEAGREELIRERVAKAQEQMRGLLAGLSQEQLVRYETFRRVGLPRPMIKKVRSVLKVEF